MEIILTTLNARYTHTSIALRYLKANLKELESKSKIMEFVINSDIETIAEKILQNNPKIIAISVYIWNALDVKKLIDIIKSVNFEVKIILGGPEVSYSPLRVDFKSADYIVSGEGEVVFYHLCKDIFGDNVLRDKYIKARVVDIKKISLPYRLYSDFDIKNRYLYVEASRGCPFECEFCLSSIDERVRYFDVERLIEEFEILWQRGARNFKFIDRTFNLNMKIANRLIDYFLAKKEKFMLHFEVIPDHFPQKLKEKIKLFPKTSLQLEVGIQTLNEKIAQNINRKLNLEKIKENISFLESSDAHLHLDLIVGLPGEDLDSFAKNLNQLLSLSTSEIQIGILKKLSGTTISRHDLKEKMIYSNEPPYDILQNSKISFLQMQKMKRFARFWDLTYNSGNFYQTIKLLWQDGDVFNGFFNFSEWIYKESESTYQISLNRLSEYLFRYLTEILNYPTQQIADLILEDIIRVEGRKIPQFLRQNASHIPDLRKKSIDKFNKRQALRE